METQELLLSESERRWTIEPIKYHDIWKHYKTHEAAIWHAHDIKLEADKKDWQTLTKDEQTFVKNVLAFFASSDLIVCENLSERFMKEVQLVEAKTFYGFQIMMENIHSEVYSNMITNIIKNETEKIEMFDAILNNPAVKKKANWAMKWISSSESFAERLVAFAVVEGIFFSGSFCCVFWLQERGKMPGLGQANDYIARDEGLHTDFACLLYREYIKNKLSQERISEIIREAVDTEIEFINESLKCPVIGMNADNMAEYIRYVADMLLYNLGHKKIYNAQQPFPFMDRICVRSKVNFFERDSTSYKKAGVSPTDKPVIKVKLDMNNI